MIETMVQDLKVLQSFFDRASVGIKILDTLGFVTYANEAELDLYGYRESDVMGRHFSEFFADQETARKFWEQVERRDASDEFFTGLLRRDGSLIEVTINTSINYNDSGILQGVCCFTRDITQYKRNSDLLEYLNRAGAELALTYDTATILEKVSQLIVPRFANWFFIDVFRKDTGKIELLKAFHQHPEKLKQALLFREGHELSIEDKFGIGRVLRTGETSFTPVVDEFTVNSNFSGKDRADILKILQPQSVIVVPMIVKESIAGAITFVLTEPCKYYEVSDIYFAKDFANRIGLALENARLYEKSQLEIAQRIEAEGKKDEFISMASHELKTPLTSIKAYNQILQKKLQDSDFALSFINKAEVHILQLEHLISDLLDVSKINAGKLTYNFSEFNFGEVLKESVESVQNIARTHEILIQDTVDVLYVGDRFRIEQVIINFLTNAIKYSPNAAEVIVRAWIKEDDLIVSVQDFGIGIAKDNLSKLFDRFYRVDNSSMKYSGLGLGLFIASEIISGHHGSFWIESEVNKGSTFYFKLPLNSVSEHRERMHFYKDSFIKAEYKEKQHWVEAVWTGFQNFQSVQKGGNQIARLLTLGKCCKLLNDNSLEGDNWFENTAFEQDLLLKIIGKTQVKYVAWVHASKKVENSVPTYRNSEEEQIQISFFSTAEQAKQWLSAL